MGSLKMSCILRKMRNGGLFSTPLFVMISVFFSVFLSVVPMAWPNELGTPLESGKASAPWKLDRHPGRWIAGENPHALADNRLASVLNPSMVGHSPIVKTDKVDYEPGQTAFITASGFNPLEKVRFRVVHTNPHTNPIETPGLGHDPWSVVADVHGNITTEWFVHPDDSLGASFLLTANGVTSGLHTSTTFTDGPGPLTITLSSQETLWLDANSCSAMGPRGAWLSFIIKNTGTDPATNVTVTFAGFTGANASYFSAPADLTRTFSSIGAGAQEPVYFYVDYSNVCNNPKGGGSPYTGYTANYTVTATAKGLSPVVRNGTVTTNELLSASAAGVAASTTLGPGFYVGQFLTQTVDYSFGNNADLFFQPAGDAGFDAGCIRLVGSEITGVSGAVSPSLIGLKDQLWFPTASVAGAGGDIYVTYTWQILCVNRTQTLHPWAAAKSGQKYKYSGFLSTTIFPSSEPALTVTKSVSPASLLDNTGGPLTWTVTFSNPTLVPLIVSKITDILPACMSINEPSSSGSDVTAANSSSLPSPGATGTVNWIGMDLGDSPATTYRVPPGRYACPEIHDQHLHLFLPCVLHKLGYRNCRRNDGRSSDRNRQDRGRPSDYGVQGPESHNLPKPRANHHLYLRDHQ